METAPHISFGNFTLKFFHEILNFLFVLHHTKSIAHYLLATTTRFSLVDIGSRLDKKVALIFWQVKRLVLLTFKIYLNV